MNTQPEALRLADELIRAATELRVLFQVNTEMGEELRRLFNINTELAEALDETNGLLAAMLHEQRPHAEVMSQVHTNRTLLIKARSTKEFSTQSEWE